MRLHFCRLAARMSEAKQESLENVKFNIHRTPPSKDTHSHIIHSLEKTNECARQFSHTRKSELPDDFSAIIYDVGAARDAPIWLFHSLHLLLSISQ
jgi:hypothetical protein